MGRRHGDVPWTEPEIALAARMFADGLTPKEIALTREFVGRRDKDAIRMRLLKAGFTAMGLRKGEIPHSATVQAKGYITTLLDVPPRPFAVTFPKVADARGGKPLRAIVYGDTHYPFQDDRALQVVKAVVKDLKPDIIVNVGDLVDCVAPDTRILTKDLRWVAASRLAVGDELIGFDENAPGTMRDGKRKKQRGLQYATVQNIRRIRRPCVRLTMSTGERLVCSEGHQWLGWKSRKNRAVVEWMTGADIARRVERGSPVLIHRAVRPWEAAQGWNGGYLNAAFDGEGSLTFHEKANNFAHLTFSQRPNDFLCNVRRALEEDGFGTATFTADGRSAATLNVTGGMWEFARFIGRYRPKRFLRKWMQKAPINGYRFDGTLRAEVVAAELIGEQDVIAMQTTTKTFLAEGFASHNCWQISRFEKDPTRKDTLQDNIDQAREHLHEMAQLAPKAQRVYLEGNHESRLRRLICGLEGADRELAKLRNFQKHLTWPALLDLDAVGWRFIPERDQSKTAILPKIITKHGTVVRKWSGATARGEWEKYGASGVSGHTHRLGHFFHRDHNGTARWIETGCTCLLDPPYGTDYDWQQGFAVLSWNADRRLMHEDVVGIREGAALWRDKEYHG